jgi:Tat protein secretion system quality control protein TatD with DNase activity
MSAQERRNMLVDTHAHNQWASFGKDREKVISRARIVDVKYIVNIGFDVLGARVKADVVDRCADCQESWCNHS